MEIPKNKICFDMPEHVPTHHATYLVLKRDSDIHCTHIKSLRAAGQGQQAESTWRTSWQVPTSTAQII